MKGFSKGKAGVLTFLLLISGCTTLQTSIQSKARSPREEYVNTLVQTTHAKSPFVLSWMRAGDVSVNDSTIVKLPFQETGYIADHETSSRFYRFEAEKGQVLTVNADSKSKKEGRLFIDLFTLSGNTWREQQSADSTLSITYKFTEDINALVRVQPELMTDALYTITMSLTPPLLNPVAGATNKDIRSYWGDERDGGSRKHEGVDIFAPKGTLVIAPTNGQVTNVGWNSLGGKVVWMTDLKKRHSFYFAHLDTQMVTVGMILKQGDSIGTVGKTGNARSTPPHLHFGVYEKKPKDPVNYIRTPVLAEYQVNDTDTTFQPVTLRVNKKQAHLFSSPDKESRVREKLPKNSYVKVIGENKYWYRVMTNCDREGFVEKTKVSNM